MADTTGATRNGGDSTPSGLTGVLSAIGKHVVPLVVGIAGAAAAVAVFGAATMWSRFFAAQVPPEQAVDAIPDPELIVTGGVVLVLFGAAGLLVMTAAYVLDRGGRQTKAVARSLLGLAVLGGLITCLIAEQRGPDAWFAAGLLLGAAALVWLLFELPWFRNVADELEEIKGETRAPPSLGRSTPTGNVTPERLRLRRGGGAVLAAIVVLYGLGIWLVLNKPWGDTTALFLAAVVFGGSWLLFTSRLGTKPANKPERLEREMRAQARQRWRRENPTPPVTPDRFRLTPLGRWITLGIVIACALAVGELLDTPWLGGAIVIAAALVWASYAVANATGGEFVWYGVSVFFCVLLFGAYLGLVDIGIHERVQPVAVIRANDAPGQGVLGFYIAENSERLYAATVAMGCNQKKIRKDSGRLVWIDKDDIKAVSIGRLQDAEDVATAPAEMLQALWAARLPARLEEGDGKPNPKNAKQAKAKSTKAEGRKSKAAQPKARNRRAGELDDESDTGDTASRAGADVSQPSPAVNFAPQIDKMWVKGASQNVAGAERIAAFPGETIVVQGKDFGTAPKVSVDDVRARITSPPRKVDGKHRIEFRVPQKAETGRVEIRCGGPESHQLVVRHRPRPSVRARNVGRNSVRLSARRSTDFDGRVTRYSWSLATGGTKRGKVITERRPQRRQTSKVTLTVTDNSGLHGKLAFVVRVQNGHICLEREGPASRQRGRCRRSVAFRA